MSVWCVLAVVWMCLAGSVYPDHVSLNPDEHFDYKFDTSFVAMKEAASGLNIPAPDFLALYPLEAFGMFYAFTHLPSFGYESIPKESILVYATVLNGGCIETTPGDHTCLTERDARRRLLKDVRLAFYSVSAWITEASARARIQLFQEEGGDDLVLMISSSMQEFVQDLTSVLLVPVQNLYKEMNKLTNVVINRYSSGTGSKTQLLLSADAVVSDLFTIANVLQSKPYTALKLYHTFAKILTYYSLKFGYHLKALYDSEEERHADSPYPMINRYWDARALEYAVTWIFKLRKDVNQLATKEFDQVLTDLYNKLVTGDIEASLEMAGHLLSKTIDTSGHKILKKYLDITQMENLINLQELNPLGVPASLKEMDMSKMEDYIHKYIDVMDEENVAMLMFNQILYKN